MVPFIRVIIDISARAGDYRLDRLLKAQVLRALGFQVIEEGAVHLVVGPEAPYRRRVGSFGDGGGGESNKRIVLFGLAGGGGGASESAGQHPRPRPREEPVGPAQRLSWRVDGRDVAGFCDALVVDGWPPCQDTVQSVVAVAVERDSVVLKVVERIGHLPEPVDVSFPFRPYAEPLSQGQETVALQVQVDTASAMRFDGGGGGGA
ncbi:hypothetical protein PG984_002806 [Apiospora sp. TS-2023a]